MPQANDLSRSLVPLEQDNTLIAVIELSQSSWLIAGMVPGIERQPLKKLDPDEQAQLQLLHRWQVRRPGPDEITRIAVAYEAGRDGFWLARWLRSRGIEVHVIHPTSVAISREHKRAKTDRLDRRCDAGVSGLAAWRARALRNGGGALRRGGRRRAAEPRA